MTQPYPSPDVTRRAAIASVGTGLAALAGIALGALGGCGKSDGPAPVAPPAPAPAPAANAPLVVGTHAAFAPFESHNERGEIVGFDIDLVQAIAASAGFEVRIVNTPWEGLFNTLVQGDRDLLISAITITDERRSEVDFSAPYFEAVLRIAVRSDSPVARLADLKGRSVGVQTGSTGEIALTRLLGATPPDIRRFESTPLALKALEAGEVDAVVADNAAIDHHIARHTPGRLRTLPDAGFGPEPYGIAVRKGNAALRERIDRALAAIRADGSYQQIHARWFGTGAAASAASR